MGIQWNGASIFATLVGVSSLGAVGALLSGHVELLLPPDAGFAVTPLVGVMLAIQCFGIGVLLLGSVYNNYAPLQLKFHALGLIPVLVLGYSMGFMTNVIQNGIIFALCVILGFASGGGAPSKPTASGTLATILMGLNVLLLLAFCATPFFFTPDELFPQFGGKVDTLTYQYVIGSAFVYVLPLTAAVLTGKASQVQPWWATCLFFNTAMHTVMMDPIDTQNAMSNGVLAVLHMSCALFCSTKAPKERPE